MSRVASNPYEILGVERNATAEEIKAAYRRMALRYHPDRNPGDREAEERFKEASEAYATLRDPTSRARFDAYGHSAERPDFETVDWQAVFREADVAVDWDLRRGAPRTGNAVFDALFGALTGMMRTSGLLPGEDREIRAAVPLGVAREGGSVRVVVPGPSVCPICRGRGRDGGNPCPRCGGRGLVRGGASVEVQVPRGVAPGARLRLRGLGGPGNPPGDVLVGLDLQLPRGVERRGGDLHAELDLTPWEASRGTRARLLGVELEIPAGTADGTVLRRPGGGVGGDLVATVRLDWWAGAARRIGEWLGIGSKEGHG